MRRAVLTAAAGVLVLSISACDGDPPAAKASPTPTPKSTSKAVSPGPGSAVKGVDYTADTKKVCGKIDQLMTGKALAPFATDLGLLIKFTQAKKPVRAKQAQQNAAKELKKLATAVRTNTSAAKNPEFKAAGTQAAAAIDASAADSAFFTSLKTVKDVEPRVGAELVGWLTPLAKFCA
jgi:hypothetical protein